MFTYSVKNLLGKDAGAKESHHIDEALALDAKEKLTVFSNLTGTVTLIRLDHEINVSISNFKITVEAACTKCLKKFSQLIFIPSVEREFIIDLPAEELEPWEDVFYVDRKSWTVDILEMVRQEILLHFPPIPVCSETCKGLCDRCGENLNIRECSCDKELKMPVRENPFKALRNLL